MEFEITDFENIKVNIKEFIDFIMPSNKASLTKLVRILYPEYIGTNINSLVKYLYVMLDGIENDYDEFSIKKKNGKLRNITKPNEALADIQKRIYKYILKETAVHPCAAAYVKGKSIKAATKAHIGFPVLVKLDIKNFFGSITFNKVKDVFSKLGFDEYQAITLANFCCYKGRLPQGTSTSPMLSNLVMKDFDEALEKYCAENGIIYTRYSDDMFFSGDFEAESLIAFVKDLLAKHGFSLNQSKTKVIRQGQRQIALGVVLNEKQQVSKEYRKQIRQEMYYCSKYSVKSHLEHLNDKRFILPNGEPDYIGYIDNLYGRINFALQINPDDVEMISYRKSLKALSVSKAVINRLEQNRLLEYLYALYSEQIKSETPVDNIYRKLFDEGFKKSLLQRAGISEENVSRFYDKVYLTRDDKGNILSLITAYNNGDIEKVFINSYCDGFFGSKLDKSLGYLIITSDKIKAITENITNLVSFNNAPDQFFLSDKKLEMIKRFGNCVIISNSENPNITETLKNKFVSAGVKVL